MISGRGTVAADDVGGDTDDGGVDPVGTLLGGGPCGDAICWPLGMRLKSGCGNGMVGWPARASFM